MFGKNMNAPCSICLICVSCKLWITYLVKLWLIELIAIQIQCHGPLTFAMFWHIQFNKNQLKTDACYKTYMSIICTSWLFSQQWHWKCIRELGLLCKRSDFYIRVNTEGPWGQSNQEVWSTIGNGTDPCLQAPVQCFVLQVT